MVLVKNYILFHLFILGKIAQENGFGDSLDGKKKCYKKRYLKRS